MSKVNIKPIKAGDMPPALRCIWNISPEKTRVTNMLVALICYCTLATRLRVRYKFDFGLHMLVANLLVIGPSGCGKSIVRWVVDFILTSLQERDQTERRLARRASYRGAFHAEHHYPETGEEGGFHGTKIW